jgi:hypothetical protein
VSATSIADATWDLFYNDWWRKREMVWDKTVRYRQAPSVAAAGTVTAPLVPLGQKVA